MFCTLFVLCFRSKFPCCVVWISWSSSDGRENGWDGERCCVCDLPANFVCLLPAHAHYRLHHYALFLDRRPNGPSHKNISIIHKHPPSRTRLSSVFAWQRTPQVQKSRSLMSSNTFWSNSCEFARSKSLQSLLDAARASCGATVRIR